MSNFGRSIEEIQKMVDTIGEKLDAANELDEKTTIEDDLLELEVAFSSGQMPEDQWSEVYDWLEGSNDSLLLQYLK